MTHDLLSESINEQFDIDLDAIEPPSSDHPTSDRPLQAVPPSCNSWPPQLIFDLALGLDSHEAIGERLGMTASDIHKFFEHPLFRQEVAVMTKELRESNAIFRNKAKTQAEAYLEDMDALMRDMDTPASTKLAIFQALTKLGELEPEPKSKNSDNQQTININVAMEQAEKRITEIDVTPSAEPSRLPSPSETGHKPNG